MTRQIKGNFVLIQTILSRLRSSGAISTQERNEILGFLMNNENDQAIDKLKAIKYFSLFIDDQAEHEIGELLSLLTQN